MSTLICNQGKTTFCLTDVERRRIYDIVNVLESVEVISRYAKNRYIWHGKARLPSTLVKLKVHKPQCVFHVIDVISVSCGFLMSAFVFSL